MTPKPPIWKRLLRWTAFALLAAVTLLALAVSWISYQGRLDWARTKAELLAKGEKLTQIELAPPPVADVDNFFADPIWKAYPHPSLNNYSAQIRALCPIGRADTPLSPAEAATFRKLFPDDADLATATRADACYRLVAIHPDILHSAESSERAAFLLQTLAPLHPALNRIRELLKRPAARWPYDYGEYFFTQGLYPYPGIMSVAKAFTVEGFIRLAFGETPKAAEDAYIILDLSEKLKRDPLLYALLVRQGILATALDVLEQGLSAHAWSNEELQEFERAIARIDLISDGALAFRGERGFDNQSIEALSKRPSLWKTAWRWSDYYNVPDGLKWKAALDTLLFRIQIAVFGPGDEAALNRLIQHVVEAFDAAPTKGFHIANLHRIKSRLDLITHPRTERFRYLVLGNADMLARQETDFRQALIVCALERYRLKYKCYPETLVALVPEFIQKLPKDVYTAKPYQYRLESPDRFRLWSVGPMPDDNDDDIVWNH